MAWMPASATGSGVSKSGSPAAREMTSTPDSRRDVARSDSTIVFEGLIAPTTGFIVISTEAPFSWLAARAIAEDFVEAPGQKAVNMARTDIANTSLVAIAMAMSRRSVDEFHRYSRPHDSTEGQYSIPVQCLSPLTPAPVRGKGLRPPPGRLFGQQCSRGCSVGVLKCILVWPAYHRGGWSARSSPRKKLEHQVEAGPLGNEATPGPCAHACGQAIPGKAHRGKTLRHTLKLRSQIKTVVVQTGNCAAIVNRTCMHSSRQQDVAAALESLCDHPGIDDSPELQMHQNKHWG